MVTFDHAGDVDAAFVAELLMAERLVVAVVGEEKDDGVIEFVVLLELVEDVLDLLVGAAGTIVMGCPCLLESGSLREVGWKRDSVILKLLPLADVTGVGLASPEHDLAKPGLLFIGAGLPGIFGE